MKSAVEVVLEVGAKFGLLRCVLCVDEYPRNLKFDVLDNLSKVDCAFLIVDVANAE